MVVVCRVQGEWHENRREGMVDGWEDRDKSLYKAMERISRAMEETCSLEVG